MKGTRQFLLIIALCLAGQFISGLLPIPFPGSVIGMLLALALLLLKVIKLDSIKDASEFLLANMAVFFVPSGANIIKYYGEIKDSLLGIAAVCVLSTIITFVVTAYTVTLVTKLMERGKKKHE